MITRLVDSWARFWLRRLPPAIVRASSPDAVASAGRADLPGDIDTLPELAPPELGMESVDLVKLDVSDVKLRMR